MKNGEETFYGLLTAAEEYVTERFQSELDGLEEDGLTYLPPLDRIELLKHRGTIRMALGQKCGQTAAVSDFIDERYRGCCSVYLSPAFNKVKGQYEHRLPGTVFSCWNSVGRLDPRGVRAIFVDPGPHAGVTAREAIYSFAAEAMMTEDGGMTPVVIYFIGT